MFSMKLICPPVAMFLLLPFCSCSTQMDLNSVDILQTQQREHKTCPMAISLPDVQMFMSKYRTNTKGKDSKEYIKPFIDSDGDTLMYIIQHNEGWEVLSSDKRTPAVLAYSEKGTCPIFEEENPSNLWLQSIASSIKKSNTRRTPN